ncbi:MAG TPA: zinc-binding alcohol dehydrogenase family protein [Geminicoccus sp.]|jgi:NADPH2:quinone reductase|uniref:zinc-binding alcohol dehydrogenase family protein n=1 Tax=Geminicoccus sp. TaxID=2024832 RepID=UPI002E33FA1A|nr:zinc-binding alcohol dehydrogenase family protein [Geminicoccus sp.]HEX2525972.1 zinc-binding alcohol dehydrogenase family protein [Geminicoccus sp.]
MRAIAFEQPGPITAENALIEVDLPTPSPKGRDLLVEVRAVSVNPVDVKMRVRTKPEPGKPHVLGYDAAGVVKAVGDQASLFSVGDEVFYAGALDRPGTNAEFHLVDERIVGRKPRTLGFAEAAALPLTSITAWEAMDDRLHVAREVPGAPRAILIVGGAGGVGSIAIQLAKLRGLAVIATASRPETQDWCRAMGADHIIDHGQPLPAQVEALGLGAPGFVFSTTHTDRHLVAIAELIAPQGRFVLIDDPATLDISPFKRKSVSVHWEFMFTRSMFQTADIDAQHRLLNQVSELVDAGRLRSTMTSHAGRIDAANLKKVHAQVESASSIGKTVLEGF